MLHPAAPSGMQPVIAVIVQLASSEDPTTSRASTQDPTRFLQFWIIWSMRKRYLPMVPLMVLRQCHVQLPHWSADQDPSRVHMSNLTVLPLVKSLQQRWLMESTNHFLRLSSWRLVVWAKAFNHVHSVSDQLVSYLTWLIRLGIMMSSSLMVLQLPPDLHRWSCLWVGYNSWCSALCIKPMTEVPIAVHMPHCRSKAHEDQQKAYDKAQQLQVCWVANCIPT